MSLVVAHATLGAASPQAASNSACWPPLNQRYIFVDYHICDERQAGPASTLSHQPLTRASALPRHLAIAINGNQGDHRQAMIMPVLRTVAYPGLMLLAAHEPPLYKSVRHSQYSVTKCFSVALLYGKNPRVIGFVQSDRGALSKSVNHLV